MCRMFVSSLDDHDDAAHGIDIEGQLAGVSPGVFGSAERDALWAQDDPAFHTWNDLLQYLGFFAFRDPVPAYKHDAAIFLHLRGCIASPAAHPDAPTRPDGDREVLAEIAARLDALEGTS